MFEKDTGLSFDDICRLVSEYKHERLIELPCKMGATIYMVVRKRRRSTKKEYVFVNKTVLSWNNLKRVLDCYGKTVFLTKHEAQKVADEIKSQIEGELYGYDYSKG